MTASLDNDIARVAHQEKTLVFDRFDSDIAWTLGTRLREIAVAGNLGVVVDVSLFSMPLFYAALEGTSPDNANWVRRKRNCVARFFRSSYAIGLSLARDGRSLQDKFGLSEADFASHGGSFPITVAGAGCIGAVTVSGLPQRQDHAMVVEALATHLGHDLSGLCLDT
ncbi:hypothetical protein ASG25_19190 [Rhizobium sp. Leaf384]|uniref:heme-degrading domain-containing protein n=1 Tax=unclassified Rhizobium TaxID=2613769 RepID=UPI000714E61E|nr:MULTISPECIES: heme-degrading domain-containing protein [unclassified Rhizobium]KQS76309.1 hypothetical protein ASG25_19190 [Rhizobium sp. Leaf384]KQS82201.1 hypothetical protein ASG58_22555 [Rhizobium sp. Leaf383]